MRSGFVKLSTDHFGVDHHYRLPITHMSKRGPPLVSYADSDDEGAEVEPEGPPKKKR
jgi:hypothetical protein